MVAYKKEGDVKRKTDTGRSRQVMELVVLSTKEGEGEGEGEAALSQARRLC